jgi:drug/metabolite transporter (DMT)-like permease
MGIGICFCVAWAYAACNVLSRKLKDIHFSVICFYHPIIGMMIGISWLLGVYTFTGEAAGGHSWNILGYVLLGCACDFIVFNS